MSIFYTSTLCVMILLLVGAFLLLLTKAGQYPNPWLIAFLGALIGAVLSAGVFVLFVIPFAHLFSHFNAVKKVTALTWPLFIQKAIAGAVAGGIGAFVGRWSLAAENQEQVMSSPQDSD